MQFNKPMKTDQAFPRYDPPDPFNPLDPCQPLVVDLRFGNDQFPRETTLTLQGGRTELQFNKNNRITNNRTDGADSGSDPLDRFNPLYPRQPLIRDLRVDNQCSISSQADS